MTTTTTKCHVYAETGRCIYCGINTEEVANGYEPRNVFQEVETAKIKLAKKKTSCIAATVNDTIVAVADDLNLGFIFAMIYAVCQYREIRLADATIKFYRAEEDPGQAVSLEVAVGMWHEDDDLRDFFDHAEIPELVEVNEIFQHFEKFTDLLKDKPLQEIFPHGNFGTISTSDV